MTLFVYGTLKKGFENHYFLEGASFLGSATTKHRYPMVNIVKAYPYLINAKGKGKQIKGEAYTINETILKRVDALEGYPDYYMRDEITILTDRGELKAVTYFLATPLDYSSLELLDSFEKDTSFYLEDFF